MAEKKTQSLELKSEVQQIAAEYANTLNETQNSQLRKQIFEYLQNRFVYAKEAGEATMRGNVLPMIEEIEDAAEYSGVEAEDALYQLYQQLKTPAVETAPSTPGERTSETVADIRRKVSSRTGLIPEEDLGKGQEFELDMPGTVAKNFVEQAESQKLKQALQKLIIDDRPVDEVESQRGFMGEDLVDLYSSYKGMEPQLQERVQQMLEGRELYDDAAEIKSFLPELKVGDKIQRTGAEYTVIFNDKKNKQLYGFQTGADVPRVFSYEDNTKLISEANSIDSVTLIEDAELTAEEQAAEDKLLTRKTLSRKAA